MKEVFVDTHVVLWLFDKNIKYFSKEARNIIETSILYYCPVVNLELQYLYEIKRIRNKPETIINSLNNSTGLQPSENTFQMLIQKASKNIWTRDVFDRLITADEQINNSKLITEDKIIRKNYKNTII